MLIHIIHRGDYVRFQSIVLELMDEGFYIFGEAASTVSYSCIQKLFPYA